MVGDGAGRKEGGRAMGKMGAYIPVHLVDLPDSKHAWPTMDQDLFE